MTAPKYIVFGSIRINAFNKAKFCSARHFTQHDYVTHKSNNSDHDYSMQSSSARTARTADTFDDTLSEAERKHVLILNSHSHRAAQSINHHHVITILT